MPKVGSKHFDYGPKGMAKAMAEAKKTGKPMNVRNKKMAGKRKSK